MLSIEILVIALALSVDAFAVSMAAAMSLAGIFLGSRLHARFGRIAEGAGGILLILVAVRIVFSHSSSS